MHPTQAQTALLENNAIHAPYMVLLAITITPGAAAIFLTITSMVFIKRINRASGYSPLSVMKQVAWIIGLGAIWGPLMQFALQRLVADLTGLRLYWELIVTAPFITGIASIGIYDFILMPYLRKKYPAVYELLKVRHRKVEDIASDNGDMTILERETPTQPRETNGT